MKLVKESLNEFGKGVDPLKTMELGYRASIIKFFEDLNIKEENYTIEETGEILYKMGLDLTFNKNTIPNNLTVKGNVHLSKTNISKLPENLTIWDSLFILYNTKLTELPDSLSVGGKIYLDKSMHKLVNWMEKTKFKDKWELW